MRRIRNEKRKRFLSVAATVSVRLFSHEQLTKIYQASLNILERIGGDFYDEEAVELLAGAGAYVMDKRRVLIDPDLVEERLSERSLKGW